MLPMPSHAVHKSALDHAVPLVQLHWHNSHDRVSINTSGKSVLTAATCDGAKVECIAIIYIEFNEDAAIVLSVWVVAAVFSTNHTVALTGICRI